MITPTRHEKLEWARCAQAAYRHGRNNDGHTLSAAASLSEGMRMSCARFDMVMAIYREWLLNGYRDQQIAARTA